MTATPERIVRRLLDLLVAKDMTAIVELWAEDSTTEFPFAAGGAPRRLSGREELRDYLADYPDRMDVREVTEVTVHHTAHPETLVVEFAAHGRTVATDAPYRLDYISVITVRDGLIVRCRDYWSPLAAASAAGALPELLSALRSEPVR